MIGYHYTNIAAFLNILKERKLWLSHISSMNDYLEVTVLLKHLEKYKEKVTSEQTKNDLDYLEFRIREHLAPHNENYYIASFSHKHDILSQWRAYADDGFGFNIGFNLDLIKEDINELGYDSCVYKEVDVFNRLHKYLQATNDIRNQGPIGETDRKAFDQFIDKYAHHSQANIHLFPYVKNEGFKEEEEIRLVTLKNNSSDDVKLRVCGKVLTNYLEVEFPTNAINSITLGPKNPYRNNVQLLKSQLESIGFDMPCIEIKLSEASYR